MHLPGRVASCAVALFFRKSDLADKERRVSVPTSDQDRVSMSLPLSFRHSHLVDLAHV